MSSQNYSLEIISHHSKFNNKALRKYYVDGIDTIGAWGDEPFEIRFKNNTYQKIQVKISLDGTDILTGERATTEATKDMWVVNAYGTLNIKAWPETNNGGAAFVFTSAQNSVAVHTHGDLSSRGIIAAAVYTEGHVAQTITRDRVDHHHHYHYQSFPNIWLGSSPTYGSGQITCSGIASSDMYTLGGVATNNSAYNASTTDSLSFNESSSEISCRAEPSKSLESLVSVGAGEHVDQKITYVTGLVKPVFTETLRVRYLWWDDLVNKLREANVPAPHASGFPGDKNQQVMSLGNTPRVGSFTRAFPRQESAPVYSRI